MMYIIERTTLSSTPDSNAVDQNCLLVYVGFIIIFTQKRVSYLYRTAQPSTLAAFRPWGSSTGAGRIRLTRCKNTIFFNTHKFFLKKLFHVCFNELWRFHVSLLAVCTQKTKYNSAYLLPESIFLVNISMNFTLPRKFFPNILMTV